MLVADEAYKQRERWRKTVETTRAVTQGALQEQKRQVVDTEKTAEGHDPTKLYQQLGRPMPANELMRKLSLINSRLQFKKNTLGNFGVLYPRYVRQPDGGEKLELTYTGVWFEDAVLPEYDVLNPKYETAWDSDVKDVVKTLKTVKITMSWRNVLGRLLAQGFISPAQVREHFAPGNRKSWHQAEQGYRSKEKTGPIVLA